MNHPLGTCSHDQMGAECVACAHTHPEITKPLWIAIGVIAFLTIGHALRKNIHVPHY